MPRQSTCTHHVRYQTLRTTVRAAAASAGGAPYCIADCILQKAIGTWSLPTKPVRSLCNRTRLGLERTGTRLSFANSQQVRR